jgi:hypothetical protein
VSTSCLPIQFLLAFNLLTLSIQRTFRSETEPMLQPWNVKPTNFKVSDFINWMKAGQLRLSPSFQRRPVWKPKAKSFFMDSIIRGLPVPTIFIREQTNVNTLKTIREIVDGQQRLRTIFAFVNSKLIKDFKPSRDAFLLDKTYSPEFPDNAYNDLPKEIKQQILDYEFSVDVLPRNADDAAVLMIFKRLNATGVRLNDQELRNAEFFGEFSNSVDKVALRNLARWRRWGLFTEDAIARMEETEFTSELFILMYEGAFGRNKRIIDTYYRDFDEEFPDKIICEKRLTHILDVIDENAGDNVKGSAFQKKTLFFTLFAALYDESYGLDSELDSSEPKTLPKKTWTALRRVNSDLENERAPKRILEAAARRTTHRINRTILVEYISKQLK